jgi:hypothetical protein
MNAQSMGMKSSTCDIVSYINNVSFRDIVTSI